MTVQEAARDLFQHFACGWHPNWLQSIGVADVSQYNDVAMIHVYLNREPWRFEAVIPETWQGFPVTSTVVGEVRIGPSE